MKAYCASAAVALLFTLAAAAQGAGVDSVSIGPVAVHDHVAFDYHIPVLNDPYPHETKEGYAYDGVDLFAAIRWHAGGAHYVTSLRVTPASRRHFDYDQDTDFEPTTDFTHGNEGEAKSRTFGVDQTIPFGHVGGVQVGYDIGFLRQWTRYHDVTTYDTNSNPALPSTFYDRLISEQAILYELRNSVGLETVRKAGAYTWQGKIAVTPLSRIFLHNYIPVTLAATSLLDYGGEGAIAVSRPLGTWHIGLSGTAGEWTGVRAIAGFRREEFTLRLDLTPPRLW